MDNIEKIEKYLVKNFDQHEIFEERSNQRSISFESNNLKEVSSNQSQGFAARARTDRRVLAESRWNQNEVEAIRFALSKVKDPADRRGRGVQSEPKPL